MKVLLRAVAAAAISFALFGAACPQVNPESKPNPGSWLVLLCQAQDVVTEPHPIAYYDTLFLKTETELLWQYFDMVSNHTVDISGSRVRGWFKMSVNAADIAPSKRNAGTNPNRSQTAQDCRNAAVAGLTNQGISVDPANYVGVITVINQPVDAGATANKSVVLSSQMESELSFVEHEMLHVYGLPHSNRIWESDASADHTYSGGTDSVYYDCWDIMSWAKCSVGYAFYDRRGWQGPGLQASYMERLNWLPPNKVYAPGPVSVQASILLAPVSQPTHAGYALARLEVPAGAYLVEFHDSTGFDRNIGAPVVLIKEERGALKKTYLVTRQNGTHTWQQGETFTDLKNFLRISVSTLTPGSGSATISINTGYSPAGVVATQGQVCGDKYVGQTIPCAAMLRCGQRRHPPLVSIDYFCDP